jgi:amidohydrolase
MTTAPKAIDPALKTLVAKAVARVLPEVVAFRHERHRTPELTWQEEATSKAILAKLEGLPGLEIRTGVAKHGIVATLTGAGPGPTVGLRADMDALPLTEASDKPYTSCKPGVMHACGHDGHMANLLGAAVVLTDPEVRRHLNGQVKFIFQPAEEGGAGGDVMVKEGALEAPDVDVIFGLHGWPELAVGHAGFKVGAIFASTAELKIVVRGRGCHAAFPHLGTDQVLIGARIVDALQSISSRFVAPTEPVAVTIAKFHGGTATNIVPAEVVLEGTVRTTSFAARDRVAAAIEKLARGIAEAHGAEAVVTLKHGYPPTVNEAKATAYLESVARAVLPKEHVHQLAHSSMGGEDFAYFLEKVPGSYFVLGVDDGRAGGYPSLHHPGYDFNDGALPVGMALFVHAALGYAAHAGAR